MNKNVIALAVAAAMAAPLAAQADVKVSGQLQAEITSLSADDAMINNLGILEGLTMNDAQEGGKPDSGNFGALNFSASEDLGNGMKAIAKVGMNVWTADHKTKGIGPRDAYVGLSGNFGTVMAGTMSTPYKMATVKWDPFLATSAQARGNGGASGLHNSYAENVIAYANKFGMAKVVAAIALDEADADGDDTRDGDHTTTFSVNAPVGPVEVALGYLSSASANAGDGAVATKLGVRYSAGAIGASFVYESVEAGLDTTILSGALAGHDQTIMLLSGTYTMGANTFALNYGQTEADEAVGNNDFDIINTSLGMVHSFSKKTSAHVAYTSIDADGDVVTGIAAGLRVKF